VPRAPTPKDPVRIVRFTDRISRQCSLARQRGADRLVCEAIANGSRRATGLWGSRGGPLVLFENRPPGGLGEGVRVLGELTRGGCLALLLVRRPRAVKKSPKNRDF
jgi:hypothetical protein